MNLIKKDKIIIENLLCYTIIFIITIAICIGFTTSPFSKVLPFTDSDSFIEIGNLLKKGKVIYKEIFDHKGPFMYLIQYIGLSILNDFTGIWILEIIALYISLLFFYKTARLWTNPISSMLCIIFIISLLPYYLSSGNYVEEFALPLVAISLYIFSTYFKDKKYSINNLQILILGICFGLAIMLRPNTAALWPSFCLVILIHLIVCKNYKLLLTCIILFSLGTFIILGIVLFYVIKNNALYDFIDSYLIFNFKYSNNSNWNKFNALIEFTKNYQFYISITGYICMMVFIKKNKGEKLIYWIASFVFFVLSFLFTAISGSTYRHYYIQLIPVYLVPIVYVFSIFEDFFRYTKNYKSFPVIVIITLIFIIMYNFESNNSLLNTTLASTWTIRSESNDDKLNTIPIANRIKEKTNEDDKIITYYSKSIIYLLTNREPASKYFYQPLWVNDTKIGEEFIKDIENNKPKAIIISPKDTINRGGENMVMLIKDCYLYYNPIIH